MTQEHTWKDSVTLDEVIDLLNDAVSDDPWAMDMLLEQRVYCNERLANHQTIQVRKAEPLVVFNTQMSEEISRWQVGILGILNGIFGIDERGMGRIQAVFNVICANECQSADFEGYKVGESCPICKNASLMLGPLVRFEKVSPKEG
jgi:hypothetical protein